MVGEQLESLQGKIRVVCNSEIDQRDVSTAKTAQQAMRESQCAGESEKFGADSKDRFSCLFDLLSSGKMEVWVLPDKTFGLIHGKAGVTGY